jgi:hypothetical protein
MRSSRWPRRLTWQRRHDQLIHCEPRRSKVTGTTNNHRFLGEAKNPGLDTHSTEGRNSP